MMRVTKLVLPLLAWVVATLSPAAIGEHHRFGNPTANGCTRASFHDAGDFGALAPSFLVDDLARYLVEPNSTELCELFVARAPATPQTPVVTLLPAEHGVLAGSTGAFLARLNRGPPA